MRISDWSSDVCSSDLFALVPGVAAADRQAEPVGEIEGRIAEYGEGRGVDIGLGKGGQPGEGVEDAHVEQGVGARVEIIEAEQALEPVAFVEQLEFLADLFVEIKAGDVDIRSEEHTSELQSLMRNSYADFRLNKKIKLMHEIVL